MDAPKMIILPSKMDKEESRVLFSSFIDQIRQKLDNEPEVIRVIVKRFNKASASFVHSKEFKHLMESTISNIDSSPGQKYVHLKEFTDELKAYEQGKGNKKREISPDNQITKRAKIAAENHVDEVEKASRKAINNVHAASTNKDASSTKKDASSTKKDAPGSKKDAPSAKKDAPSAKSDAPSSTKQDVPIIKINDEDEVERTEVKPSRNGESPLRITPTACAESSSTSGVKMDTDKSGDPSKDKTEDPSNQKDEEQEKGVRGSKKQIMKLEKLLKEIHEEIQKIQEQDMTLDELNDEASLYIIEDRYKKKMIKVWNKLCELKGRDCGTGRVTEKRFVYEGTSYSEINRKVSAFINKKKIFPDYNDVQEIIHSCNQRYGLKISRKILQNLGKQVFVEIGNKLQERRKTDFVNNFGCRLTDGIREYDDPALFDRELSRKLDHNKDVGKSKLEEIINKYAQKEDQGEEEEDEDEEEDEEKNQSDEEVDQEVEMEIEKAEKEDEKSLRVEAQMIEESESSEEEIEYVDDSSSIDEPILKEDYVVDGLQCTFNDTSPENEALKSGDKDDEGDEVEVLSSSSDDEEDVIKPITQARQDCSRLVHVEKPKENDCSIKLTKIADSVSKEKTHPRVVNKLTRRQRPVPVKNSTSAVTLPDKEIDEEVVMLSDDDDDCNIVTPPPVRLKTEEGKINMTTTSSGAPLPFASTPNAVPLGLSQQKGGTSVATFAQNRHVVVSSHPALGAKQSSQTVVSQVTPLSVIKQQLASSTATRVVPIGAPLLGPGSQPLLQQMAGNIVPAGIPQPFKAVVHAQSTPPANLSPIRGSPPIVVSKTPSKSPVTPSENSGRSTSGSSANIKESASRNSPKISANATGAVENTNDYLRRIAGALTATPVVLDDDEDDVIALDEPDETNKEKTFNHKHLGDSVKAKLNFEPSRDYIKNLASKAVERIVRNTLRNEPPIINICDTQSQESSSQNGALDDIVILD